ncbi:protein FAR1-RELATED SEQUENCE 3-like [Aegilops tauschii subsp. strangulata]|uniref:protein FAR1-RELATED SEQUENCE 3-like n=1 Tax=Aegilops tauschii subsp. strangulata TaxID=200361 RepID=UPI003CC87478
MDFTIQYFERRQAENPQFYYAKTVDKETNSVTGLFWVDGRTRALYPKYKDCIFFDTTFCTNRYNMPFAPIVGVNNHLQTMLLGCALLSNEQIELSNAANGTSNEKRQYEVLQETMLDREDNQAFIGAATTTPLYSRYRIERQAVGFYTRNVFGKFQAEVTASTGFVMNQVPSPDIGSMRFVLFSNYYEDPKIFTVNVVLAEETFECSCNCFEMNGIICAHIVRVMVHLNVQAIPQHYLLERWSERATTPTGGSGHLLDFALPSNNTLKYNSLCRKFTWLASQACSNDVAYKILNDAAHALEPIILAARRGELPEQQEAQ